MAAEQSHKPIKLHIDKEAYALYLRLDDSAIVESEEFAPGVVLDYNEANRVAGIEMIPVSKRSLIRTYPPLNSLLPDLHPLPPIPNSHPSHPPHHIQLPRSGSKNSLNRSISARNLR